MENIEEHVIAENLEEIAKCLYTVCLEDCHHISLEMLDNNMFPKDYILDESMLVKVIEYSSLYSKHHIAEYFIEKSFFVNDEEVVIENCSDMDMIDTIDQYGFLDYFMSHPGFHLYCKYFIGDLEADVEKYWERIVDYCHTYPIHAGKVVGYMINWFDFDIFPKIFDDLGDYFSEKSFDIYNFGKDKVSDNEIIFMIEQLIRRDMNKYIQKYLDHLINRDMELCGKIIKQYSIPYQLDLSKIYQRKIEAINKLNHTISIFDECKGPNEHLFRIVENTLNILESNLK